jgi:hypothetical protein
VSLIVLIAAIALWVGGVEYLVVVAASSLVLLVRVLIMSGAFDGWSPPWRK